MVINPDVSRHPTSAACFEPPARFGSEIDARNVGRITKSVATAIRSSLSLDGGADLPEPLATLVERLHEGPLGQSKLKPRRVA